MFALLVLAAAVVAPAQVNVPGPRVKEIEHAVSAGRVHQAKAMLTVLIAAGGKGPLVDRLRADVAYASGSNEEALARYAALLQRHPDNGEMLERAASAALKVKKVVRAKALAERAAALEQASWRAWNVSGVIADLEGNFSGADLAYEKALELEPDQAEILNNVGWSRMLRGDWEGAIAPLERAVLLAPGSARAVNNLELARAALDDELPGRRSGETMDSWAARLNDAGVAARHRGERARAVAAFARAIEARESWYGRAARNLEAISANQ